MLIYHRTSLLDSTAQTLVNTVNCVGVMGKGIAKAFKEREPGMYAAYRGICERQLLEPGKLWLWHGTNSWVLNFPTKVHWRNPSRLEWIEAGLQKFVSDYSERGIREISFPRLGCGNGGLDWDDVRLLMEKYLQPLNIPVYIHDFTVDIGLPEHAEQISRQISLEEVHLESFETFIAALRRILELGGGSFMEIDSSVRFHAEMDEHDNLKLETKQGIALIEREDIRGIWVTLDNGLFTKANAGWSDPRSGDALLALLSLLPQARLVQVESAREGIQFAVELRRSALRSLPVPDVQSDRRARFEWA